MGVFFPPQMLAMGGMSYLINILPAATIKLCTLLMQWPWPRAQDSVVPSVTGVADSSTTKSSPCALASSVTDECERWPDSSMIYPVPAFWGLNARCCPCASMQTHWYAHLSGLKYYRLRPNLIHSNWTELACWEGPGLNWQPHLFP